MEGFIFLTVICIILGFVKVKTPEKFPYPWIWVFAPLWVPLLIGLLLYIMALIMIPDIFLNGTPQ